MTSSSSHGPRYRRGVGAAAAVAGVVGALGLAGCGIQSTSMKVVGSAPTLQAANAVTGGGNPGGSGENQYELFFFHDHKLTPVVRYTNDTVTQELIMSALIKGPNSTDSADGYSSAIPGNLSVVSYTAHEQQWNYEYSEPMDLAAKAEIVCSIEADLNAPSVGTWSADTGNEFWNDCNDFSDDFGAPLLSNPGTATASATDSANSPAGN